MAPSRIELEKEQRVLEAAIRNAEALEAAEDPGERSADELRASARPLLDCLWRHCAGRDDLRRRAAAALSSLLAHDVVWLAVKRDIACYVKMVREEDSSPFTPNPLTVLRDAPYRAEAASLLNALLNGGSGIAEEDVRSALEGQLSRMPVACGA